MKKFSFIILHYNTLSETTKCIEYIFALNKSEEVKIIVINNNSTDDSFSILNNKYSSEQIDFIDSEYNTGFAKGNNLGYSIAKHKYNSQFIICMNSDVFIKQINFLELIEQEYTLSQFHLLGPAIYTLNGGNQNPVKYVHDTKFKINKSIFLNRIRYLKSFFFLKHFKGMQFKKNDNKIEEYRINVPIHGACVIVSPRFIKEREYLFYPDTFMYGEEDIMFVVSRQRSEKIVYSSKISVFHFEDASTINTFANELGKRKRFVLKNSNKSLNILKKIIDENS